MGYIYKMSKHERECMCMAVVLFIWSRSHDRVHVPGHYFWGVFNVKHIYATSQHIVTITVFYYCTSSFIHIHWDSVLVFTTGHIRVSANHNETALDMHNMGLVFEFPVIRVRSLQNDSHMGCFIEISTIFPA